MPSMKSRSMDMGAGDDSALTRPLSQLAAVRAALVGLDSTTAELGWAFRLAACRGGLNPVPARLSAPHDAETGKFCFWRGRSEGPILSGSISNVTEAPTPAKFLDPIARPAGGRKPV